MFVDGDEVLSKATLILVRLLQALLAVHHVSAHDLGCEITAIHAAGCALKMSGSDKRILATLNDLKSKPGNPNNHDQCPRIVCNGQTLASLNKQDIEP